MDILQQVKAKLEEMKAKYNQERDEEDFPNHSDGNGMYWSGVFACLKEISFFVDHLEVKEVDLELTLEDVSMIRQIIFDYNRQVRNEMSIPNDEEYCKEVLKRFKAQKGE